MPKLTQTRKRHIKKVRLLANRSNVDIWCEDECHFQQHGSRCVMWVPPEDVDPIVLHAPTRKSVGMFGAVRVHDGCLVTQQEKTFNGISFESFLHQLLRHYRKGRKMVVILDNARWHRARVLAPWLHQHRAHLSLDFLPPYSPDLNPIERVWKLTRRLCTHNRYFPDLEDLINAVQDQFSSWRKPNLVLRRLCAIT